jgi:hypothetical protein
LYFILGATALGDKRAPDLEIHGYVRDELTGLGRNKPHLKAHFKSMLSLFPITSLTVDHSDLVEEKEFLEAQYDEIQKSGKVKLGDAPSNVDLTMLAIASIHGCFIATLEHSLFALAKAILPSEKVMTLAPVVEKFLSLKILMKADIQKNMDNMPGEEKIRADDRASLKKMLS